MRNFSSSYLVVVMALAVSTFSSAESHKSATRQEADVTRKVAPPYYTGVLQLEPREVSGEVKMCPVLKVKEKTYRLRTYTESSCKKTIDNCKPGDRCVVKGEVGSDGDLFAEEFTSFSKVEYAPAVKAQRMTKKTTTGEEFKKASEEDLKAAGVKDPKKFGEAWEDPSGMIWSDIAKNEDGSPLFMSHKDAEAYCKSLGAELPSGYFELLNGTYGFPSRDSDFVRLRKYMGAMKVEDDLDPAGYSPQILPNLNSTNEISDSGGLLLWSSSVSPVFNVGGYVFRGSVGSLTYGLHSIKGGYSVRCVVRAGRVDS